jgi:hypothetical protein
MPLLLVHEAFSMGAAMMNKIVTTGNMPRLCQIFVRANEILTQWGKRFGCGELATFDAILPQAQAVLADLQADQEPAPRPVIANHITIVSGCFSSGPASAETYARTMMEYVAAMQSPTGDLEDACYGIIRYRTSPFQPTIAEVLNALTSVKEHREDMIRQITEITSMDRNKLVQAEEQERQIAASRQMRMVGRR